MEIHPQQVLKKAESGGMLWNLAGCLIPLFRLLQEVAECPFSLQLLTFQNRRNIESWLFRYIEVPYLQIRDWKSNKVFGGTLFHLFPGNGRMPCFPVNYNFFSSEMIVWVFTGSVLTFNTKKRKRIGLLKPAMGNLRNFTKLQPFWLRNAAFFATN